MSDVTSGRRFYLRSKPALVGAPRQTTASHEADNSLTCDMSEDPGNAPVVRSWRSSVSGNVFFGSWISPALAAGVVSTGNWLFNVACREIGSACDFFLKHTLYHWRAGSIVATLLATVTEATEAANGDGAASFSVNESDTLLTSDGNGISVQAGSTYLYRSWVPKQSGWLRSMTMDAWKVGNPGGSIRLALRSSLTGSDLMTKDYALSSLPAYGGSATLDQQQTTQDTGEVFGRSSSVMYAGQGFTTGAGTAGKGLTKLELNLWKQGSPSDNLTLYLRSSISGSNLGNVTVAGSTLGGSVGTSTTDQSYDPGTGVGSGAYDATWLLQSFTPSVNKAVVNVDLKLQRVGSPAGNVEVAIRDAKTGSDLATATMSAGSVSTSITVYTFTFSSKPYLLSGTQYFIVMRVPSGDASNFIYWNVNTSGSYSGGSGWSSSDSGSSWTEISGGTYDFYFTERSAAPTFSYISFDGFEQSLAGSDQLYFVLTRSGSASAENNYLLGANSAGGYSGANNFERYSADGSSWTDRTGWDACFKTYYESSVATQLIQSYPDPYYVTGGQTYYLIARHNGTGTIDSSNYFGWHTLSPTNYAERVPDQNVEYGSSSNSGSSWSQLRGAFQSRFELVGADGQAPFYPRDHTVSVTSFTAQDGDRILYELTGSASYGGLDVQLDGAILPSAITTAILGGAASYVEATPDISLLWDTLLNDSRAGSYPIVYIHAPVDLCYSNVPISAWARPVHGELLSVGELSRTIGDEYGSYSISDITLRISDTTGKLRAWLSQQAQSIDPVLEYRKLIGKTISVGLMLYRATDGISDSRDVFRGVIETVDCDAERTITLRVKAESFYEQLAFSQLYTYSLFPFMSSTVLNQPCNLVFGNSVSKVVCHEIDIQVFKHLASLGKCGVTYVYKDTTLLATPADYSIINTTLANGLRATIIDLVVDPGSSVISCIMSGVKGLPDAYPGEYTITNPAEALYEILTTYGPLHPQQIDYGLYLDAYDKCATRGMTINGAFQTQMTIGTLLAMFAQHFDMDFFMTAGGRLGMSVCDFADASASPRLRLSESEIDALQYAHKENLRYEGATINYAFDPKAQAYTATNNVYLNTTRAREIYATWDPTTSLTVQLGPGVYQAYAAQAIHTNADATTDPMLSVTTLKLWLKGASGFADTVGVFLAYEPGGSSLYSTTLASGVVKPNVWTEITISIPTSTIIPWINVLYVHVVNQSATHDIYLPDKGSGSGSGLYMSPAGAYGTYVEISPGQILCALSVTADWLDTATERYKAFNLNLVGDSTTAEAFRAQFERKHANPHPLHLSMTLPRRALSLELGDLVEVNHRAGGAIQFNRLQCQVRSIGYAFGSSVRVQVRVNDVLDGCILGDDAMGASTWPSATIEDKRYLYLSDETTGKFANGDVGKSLVAG